MNLFHSQNPNCDGVNCTKSDSEVRILPVGGSNYHVCESCFEAEMRYRKKVNAEIVSEGFLAKFDIYAWEFLKKVVIIFMFLSVIVPNMYGADSRLEKFLYILGEVESGNNDIVVGDSGKSIGRYQIQEPYFIDAKEFSLKNKDKYKLRNVKYSDVVDPVIARNVVLAYFERYEPVALKNLNFEVLARLHNSGLSWKKKTHLTDKYWDKVKILLDRYIGEYANLK